MADLRSCYFCGTGPGGSLESYGVVPSALDPSQDQQQTVVLCPDCRNKLTALMRPVVEAAGGTPVSPETDDPGTTESGGPDGGLSAGEPAEPNAREPTSRAGDADAAPTDDHGDSVDARDSSSHAGRPASSTDSAESVQSSSATGFDEESTSADDTPGRSITFDESTASDDAGDGGTSGSGLAGSANSTEPEESGQSGGSSQTGGETSEKGADGGARSRPTDPSAEAMLGNDTESYRKVIRLLQNREFPVPRTEIEELAANAYDLTPQECSDAIDTIIQKGLLVEAEGMLQRPAE